MSDTELITALEKVFNSTSTTEWEVFAAEVRRHGVASHFREALEDALKDFENGKILR